MSEATIRRMVAVAALIAMAWGGPGPARGQSVVRALLVLDTDAGIAGLEADRGHVERILAAAPPGRVQQTVLSGPQVDRDAILRHVETVVVNPDDALFVYYSGHGATDPTRGHAFELHKGGTLFRSELRTAMMRRNPRLIVLLSDSCSNRKLLAGGAAGARTVSRGPNPALVSRLFFDHRGMVDVNSSTYSREREIEQVSWGESQRGGLFTFAFYNLLCRDDLPDDIRWHEFSDRLRRSAEEVYASYRSNTLAGRSTLAPDEREILVRQDRQTPQTLTIGPIHETVLPNDLATGPPSDSGPRLGLSVLARNGPGLEVTDVEPGSPAALRGFEPGDIVFEVDGSPVATEDQFTAAIDRIDGPRTVRFVIGDRNDGRRLSVAVRLAR